MLASLFIGYIVITAILNPAIVGEAVNTPRETEADRADLLTPKLVGSIVAMGGIVTAVPGGTWVGLFTPTDGAGAGAALALLFAFLKSTKLREFMSAVFSVGKTATPMLILLFTAALYSRELTMTGVTTAIREFFVGSGLQAWHVFAIIVLLWFILGMVVDSISIMLLTVPIAEPIAVAFGFDRLSFAIVGILAIEAGLLTPPIGLLVYTVTAAIEDPEVGVQRIFRSSVAYWGIMLFAAALLMTLPGIANWLPSVLM